MTTIRPWCYAMSVTAQHKGGQAGRSLLHNNGVSRLRASRLTQAGRSLLRSSQKRLLVTEMAECARCHRKGDLSISPGRTEGNRIICERCSKELEEKEVKVWG